MTRYELSLSPDYVPSWTVVDAVRELFQNALDQQTVESSNKMFVYYNEETETVRIGNKHSQLQTSSLLMGASTKAGDARTIGQFGEGYKVATLVLTRLGKKIKIYNYAAREIWEPKLIDSRRYGSKILAFDVTKTFIWHQAPDNDLTIEIQGITQQEYYDITESNLHLQEDHGLFIETDVGIILLDERYKSKVFVNGLYVCEYAPYHMGYNFNPGRLKLDRDRKLADPFNLEWLASTMWSKTSNLEKRIIELTKLGAADVKYINSTMSIVFDKTAVNVANKALEDFQETYGTKAVPVASQEEVEQVPRGYEPIVVPNTHKELIQSSPKYEKPVVNAERLSVEARLFMWYERYKASLSLKAKREFNKLMKELD